MSKIHEQLIIWVTQGCVAVLLICVGGMVAWMWRDVVSVNRRQDEQLANHEVRIVRRESSAFTSQDGVTMSNNLAALSTSVAALTERVSEDRENTRALAVEIAKLRESLIRFAESKRTDFTPPPTVPLEPIE